MRKVAALVLLIALSAVPFQSLSAQMRERRVGQTPPATSAPRPLPRATPARTTQGGKAETPTPQEINEEVGDEEVVRVNTALVTIPVSIMDRDGRFISGLRKEDFRIFEDGTEQQVAYFATTEVPFTVALVLDTSGSTRFKLDDIQDAAIAFLDQLGPEDKVLVVSFDDDIRFHAEATSDRRALRNAIRQTRTGGGTRLYDAVDQIIKKRFNRIKGRKAIVLFTDGVDSSSKHASMSGNLADAEELDAIVYPIQYDTYLDQGGGGGGWPGGGGGGRGKPGIGDILTDIILGGGGRGGRLPGGGRGGGGTGTTREEYRRAGEYLREMAVRTGGRHHTADDLSRLEYAFTNIADELRRQYSLGYYPTRQSSAVERRQLKVRVKRPNLVVRARDNYVYRPSGAGASTTAQDAGQQQRQPPELRKRQFNASRDDRMMKD